MFPLLVLRSDSLWYAHIMFVLVDDGGLMVFRRKKRKAYMSGQIRQEDLLAEGAVVIEGRKEWHCRVGSGTNVPLRQQLCVWAGHTEVVGELDPAVVLVGK